jgi:hypothetical protein
MNVKNCKQFQQKWFGLNQKGHGRGLGLYSVVCILQVASSKILSSSCAKAHSVGTRSSKATPLCSHVCTNARSNSRTHSLPNFMAHQDIRRVGSVCDWPWAFVRPLAQS